MDFRTAMEAVVENGERVRLPYWNDESWMELHNGTATLFIGGKPCDCAMRPFELLRDDWIKTTR